MSLSLRNDINGAVLEKVILGNDLAALSPIEKVQYVNGICKTLGLNPATQPIALLKFQGKEVPYMRKDGTEQLRKLNSVSISNLDNKLLDGGLYVVTATATLPNGRQDSSTGAVQIAGLKGDALANAIMKAETKAKRRVTLSICGLGFMDESEIDSIPNAKKVEITPIKNEPVISLEFREIEEDLLSISQCETVDELQAVFTPAYKYFIKCENKDLLKQLITAKDKKKSEIEVNSFNQEIDQETGEVVS